MRTKSALVIGMDGTIGAGVLRLFRAKGIRTYGTTRRPLTSPTDVFLEMSNRDLTTAHLPQTDVAIICTAANGFAYCRSNPGLATQINADAPRVLARELSLRGTRVVYLSSSAVFDFGRPNIGAEDLLCPLTVYGRSKAAGEESVLAVGQTATIVRLTKVLTPEMTLIRRWIGALRSGKRVLAFSDLHFCPISLEYIARALWEITEAALPGIFQVSGADDITYFDAAKHIAMRLGLDSSRVIEDLAAARGIPREEIPTFTSLDTSRYTALTGEVPPQPFEVLDAVYGPAIANVFAAQ